MPTQPFIQLLNEQLGYEFGAHQQYVAIAAYYEGQSLRRLADFFYRQALEEREHAMMMLQYLLDSGSPIEIPSLAAPQCSFTDIIEPVKLALAQEERVTEQITVLAKTARNSDDLASEQFMQWFIKEQVEEVATMSELLTVVSRTIENPMLIEDYLVREHGTPEAADPTAPKEAGSGA